MAARGISTLFNSRRFSDITVRCGAKEWPAHKSVLCTQSEFFARACEGGFKESNDNVIELHDDEPIIVEAMLRHLYNLNYCCPKDLEGHNMSLMVFHVRVYAIAEKYLLNTLRASAAGRFPSSTWNLWHTDTFVDAIEEAYRTTHDHDKKLRQAIIDTVLYHLKELFVSDRRCVRFREVTRQLPGFAAEVMQALLQKFDPNVRMNIYECPTRNCREQFIARVGKGQHVEYECDGCKTDHTLSFEELKSYKKDGIEFAAYDDGD